MRMRSVQQNEENETLQYHPLFKNLTLFCTTDPSYWLGNYWGLQTVLQYHPLLLPGFCGLSLPSKNTAELTQKYFRGGSQREQISFRKNKQCILHLPDPFVSNVHTDVYTAGGDRNQTLGGGELKQYQMVVTKNSALKIKNPSAMLLGKIFCSSKHRYSGQKPASEDTFKESYAYSEHT